MIISAQKTVDCKKPLVRALILPREDLAAPCMGIGFLLFEPKRCDDIALELFLLSPGDDRLIVLARLANRVLLKHEVRIVFSHGGCRYGELFLSSFSVGILIVPAGASLLEIEALQRGSAGGERKMIQIATEKGTLFAEFAEMSRTIPQLLSTEAVPALQAALAFYESMRQLTKM